MVLDGLLTILSAKNVLYIAIATAAGLAVGALPGLTATMAVALLVPITFTLGPISGLAVLGAIYMSAIYGGCFSAILINTPGTPGSIATAFDGYPMARKGEGAKAIFAATYASMFGGLLSLLALFFLSPPLARIALKFGPPEYFWLAIFGLTVMSNLGEGSFIKTFLSGGIGLILSCIGITHMGGELRFGFGRYELQGGVELIAGLIGLFCIPEALNFMGTMSSSIYSVEKIEKRKRVWISYFREFWDTRKTLIRSTLIGTIIGILPGAGGTVANVVAYNDAKTYSNKTGFGTGIMDGIVAPESANNATVGGGLIPTLTLGIPGTPVDAVILGALMIHTLHPGPQLFQKSGLVVYSFMWALVISTLLMGIIGLSMGVALYKGVSRVATRYLAPTIIFLSIIGSYSLRNSMVDVWMMLALGVIGYGFKLLGMSTSAAVLGLVLGQIAEEGLVQAAILSRASSYFGVFFFRPISAIIIILAILTFFWPTIANFLAKKKKGKNNYDKKET